MNASQLIVARDDLKQSKFIETALPEGKELPEEAVLVKVERFAFTANNITYALAGDQLKYWNLFPAPQGFGNIPVWGFGDVIASRHPNIAEGERLFGYFPMATHLVIEAADVTKRGLRDAAPHRQVAAPAGIEADGGAQIGVEHSTVNFNGTGVQANGTIWLDDTEVSFNQSATSGIPTSFGNNRFYANVNPPTGFFTGSPSTDRGQN